MTQLVAKPDHGSFLIQEGKATNDFQLYLDAIQQALNNNLLGQQVQLTSYTVSTLPSAETVAGLIYVTDESGGEVPAFSDSAGNWRRITDRTIVS